MSVTGNADVSRLQSLRPDGVQERKSALGAREVVDFAKSFAAMLETLNSVDAGKPQQDEYGQTIEAPEAPGLSPAVPGTRPVAAGVATIMAQGGFDPVAGMDTLPAEDHAPVIPPEVAIEGAAKHSDFRWLTTLIAQQIPAEPQAE